MKITQVTEKDAQTLLDIYAPYVDETAVSFEYEVPSLEEFTSRIKSISSKYPYIKIEEDDEVLGYAYASTFKGRKAYDWSVEITVYVKNDSKHRGCGRVLYETLEKSLSKMGITNMNACIAMPIGDDPYLTSDSYEFHKKMGFELVGTFHHSGYKFGRWYDMVWMEKIIGNHSSEPRSVDFGNWDV